MMRTVMYIGSNMKFFTIFIALFLSLAVQADNKWHDSTIKTIYPTADGGFVLILDTDSSNCPQTAVGKYHYVTVGDNSMTTEGANKIYSLALMAAATDKVVNIYFNDATNRCAINRMHVSF